MPRPKQKTSKRSAKTQRKSPPRVGKGAAKRTRLKTPKVPPAPAALETPALDGCLAANARAREMAQLPSTIVLADRRPPGEGWTEYLDAVGVGATERYACILARVSYSSMQSFVKADKERVEAEQDARELFIAALLEEGKRLAMISVVELAAIDPDTGQRVWSKRDSKIAASKLAAIRWILSTRDRRFVESTKVEHTGGAKTLVDLIDELDAKHAEEVGGDDAPSA